jgi:hypothetical protein
MQPRRYICCEATLIGARAQMKQRIVDLQIEVALPCALASLTVLFGVLGLFDGSWAERIFGSRADLHAIFGLLLCTLITAHFLLRLRRAVGAPPAYVCQLSRELSRMVYLLLYLIIGLRQMIGLADWLRYGSTAGFAKFSANDDLLTVVAYGVVGLLLIRGLAFVVWRRGTRGATGTLNRAPMAKSSDPKLEQLPSSQS